MKPAVVTPSRTVRSNRSQPSFAHQQLMRREAVIAQLLIYPMIHAPCRHARHRARVRSARQKRRWDIALFQYMVCVHQSVSPTDRSGAVLAKLGGWLTSSSQLVWAVDPMRQLVTVYRADGSQTPLGVHDAL